MNEFANRSALRALQSMVASLSNVPGRKTLIFVSGGYPASQGTLTDIASIIEAANRANVAIYPMSRSRSQEQTVGCDGRFHAGRLQPRTRGVAPEPAAGSGADTSVDNTPTGIQQVLYSLARTGTGGYVQCTSANPTFPLVCSR